MRELENILERAFTLCDRTRIEPRDLNLPSAVKRMEPSAARESAHGEPSAARDSAHGEPSAARDSAHGEPSAARDSAHGESDGDAAPTETDGLPAIAPSVGVHRLEPGQSLEEYLERIERDIITTTLEATRWNKTAAAKKLGITFRALRYRLKKLNLE